MEVEVSRWVSPYGLSHLQVRWDRGMAEFQCCSSVGVGVGFWARGRVPALEALLIMIAMIAMTNIRGIYDSYDQY